MIDSKVREDFLGLEQAVFFNNAANAPLLKTVKSAIVIYLQEITSLRDGFTQGSKRLQQLREHGARLLGCNADEIGFTTNTSSGMNLAVTGLDWQPGDEIIVADNEFPAVVYLFRELESRGVKLVLAPSPHDNFSLPEIEKLLTSRTRLLAVSFVQYFNGYRNDIKTIGKFCRKHGLFYVVDGIQGIGCCPIDVHDCHIDIFSSGGQKWLLCLPGSGIFYISDKAKKQLHPLHTGWMGIDWGADFSDLRHFNHEPFEDARRHTLGTYPFIHLWALEAATSYVADLGVDNIFAHNLALLDRLIEYVQADDFYSLRSSIEPQHRSSFISFGSPAGPTLQKYLVKQGFLLVYRQGGSASRG